MPNDDDLKVPDLSGGPKGHHPHGPRPSGPPLPVSTPPPAGWHSRGYLPHFDASGLIQSITYRLADALPADVVARIERRLLDSPDDQRTWRLRASLERYLDSGRGGCLLRRPEVAQVVIDAWQHFDGERYRLHAWVVMPNHVHVLVAIDARHPVSHLVRSWKTFTARTINQQLGRQGALWMPEYWERYIRDEVHYARVVDYIHHNPVKAGLADRPQTWRWSSAYVQPAQ